jgi:tetratricopeptide (TPR) repeat protein
MALLMSTCSASSGTSRRSSIALAGLLVGVLTAALWAPALRNGFVWDDTVILLGNPRFNPPMPGTFVYYCTHPFWHLYMPVTAALYTLVAMFNQAATAAPMRPLLFHLACVIAHVIAVIALFDILNRVIRNPLAVGAGALLFAVHPIQVEAVAYVGVLNNPLCGAFALVAITGYLRWVEPDSGTTRRRWSPLSWATAALLLAQCAKPLAVVVPPIAALLDLAAYGRGWRRTLRDVLPWCFIVLPFAVVTAILQGGAQVAVGVPAWFRFVVAGDAIAFYAHKVLLPIGLCVDYARTPESLRANVWVYFTWLAPAALLLLSAWLLRVGRARALAAGILIFLLALLPNCGIAPFDFQQFSTTADRYAYLAMIGAAVCFAWLVDALGSRRRAAMVTLPVLVLLLAAVQQRQLRFWQDDRTLFERALAMNPQSWWSWSNLSHDHLIHHRYTDAVTAGRRSIDLHPDNFIAYENLGLALTALGDYHNAAIAFKLGVHYNPGDPQVMLNCADALRRDRQWDEAIRIYSILARAHPELIAAQAGLESAQRQLDGSEPATRPGEPHSLH